MNIAKLAIISAILVCAMKVSFADEQAQKIAFVDMQKLEEKAVVSKDLMNKLSSKFDDDDLIDSYSVES